MSQDSTAIASKMRELEKNLKLLKIEKEDLLKDKMDFVEKLKLQVLFSFLLLKILYPKMTIESLIYFTGQRIERRPRPKETSDGRIHGSDRSHV